MYNQFNLQVHVYTHLNRPVDAMRVIEDAVNFAGPGQSTEDAPQFRVRSKHLKVRRHLFITLNLDYLEFLNYSL